MYIYTYIFVFKSVYSWTRRALDEDAQGIVGLQFLTPGPLAFQCPQMSARWVRAFLWGETARSYCVV